MKRIILGTGIPTYAELARLIDAVVEHERAHQEAMAHPYEQEFNECGAVIQNPHYRQDYSQRHPNDNWRKKGIKQRHKR